MDRPILFSAPMVRAILSGAKTQTRRVVKPQPHSDTNRWYPDASGSGKWMATRPSVTGGTAQCWGWAPCPYGQPGDRLYVKERCWIWGRWTRNGLTATGRQKWRFRADPDHRVRYDKPESVAPRRAPEGFDGPEGWVLRLPRFCPRWASRITLGVTGVRVERVQDISEEDAKAEGVSAAWPCYPEVEHREGFRKLWGEINGAESWNANPWVWAISLKRIEAAAGRAA